jgi:alkylation response protein AidB-like acyl-CoA dehydrogenase
MQTGEIEARARNFLAEHDHRDLGQFTFRGLQFDAGLALVHFPEGKGGLGVSRAGQALVDRIFRDAGVPYHDLVINPIGIGMGAPTVLTYGTEEVHKRYLRPLFTGEEIWCQLFSEPSHGSDVAGIQSRGVRDGDEWVVNGQKVWTTVAHLATFGMLLTRTNADVPKHAGLSYFVLDMQSPGVEVRPLFQITGEAEFNEVFLTDVRVPNANMLGREGDGWKVATTTLMNERVAISGETSVPGAGPIRSLVNLWSRRAPALEAGERARQRDRIAGLWIEAEILRLTNQRARASAQGGNPGPEGSIGKLHSAELVKRILDTCINLQGATGMLHEGGYPMTRPDATARRMALSGQFLHSPANTIAGGTSEIMRNILGERVLGLPAEPRSDKDVPWSQIPR